MILRRDELRSRRRTLALPVEVRGSTVVGSVEDQRKCSSHTCVRGLKSGTSSPFRGSRASTCVHFFPLQLGHAKERLLNSVLPPRKIGITWSAGKVATCES